MRKREGERESERKELTFLYSHRIWMPFSEKAVEKKKKIEAKQKTSFQS